MAIALKPGKHTSARVASRLRRQVRGRKKVSGTAERPRLVVTRSSKHISVQVVDDLVGSPLAQELDAFVPRWLRDTWGFRSVHYTLGQA